MREVPLKFWWEIRISQSLVFCPPVGWDVVEPFLRKIGQEAWEPEQLFFNQEADHDPADHKTGRKQCLHAQVQGLIFHKVVEGALRRDHYFCLQIPACQAQIRLGDR